MATTWKRNIVIDGTWLASNGGILPGLSGRSLSPKDRVNVYEKRVVSVLNRIYNGRPRTWTGRLLLNAIDALHPTRSVTIVPPYQSTDQQCRAARPLDRCQWSTIPEAAGCTGVGTDVYIWYEPVFWDKLDHHFKPDPFGEETLDDHGDRRSDDVLVHELFHALQSMTGTLVLGTTDKVAANGWVFLCEFQAVLVENIDRSETKRTYGLRGDYALAHHRLSSKPGGAELVASDKKFYRAYRHEIDALCDSPPLSSFIGHMTSRIVATDVWNPIRARQIVKREDEADRARGMIMYAPGSTWSDLLSPQGRR